MTDTIKGKKFLVAGGTGLVGANLTQRLKNLGADVLSSYFSKPPSFLREIYKNFDFTKFEDCLEAVKNRDYVVICAAQSFGAKMMKENPTVSILPNLKINAGLLEACRLNKVGKVVLLSSSTVYPEADYPISEDQLDLNASPYELYFGVGWLNRYIEQLAKFYAKTYGMKIGILRPTNIYGPFDKFDDEKSHVLPALIKRAFKKENPFIVWGDGSAVRDFIFVDDFIDDLLKILENYCVCDPVNVGSGEELSVKAAVGVILDVCGHKAVPRYDETKPTAIPYRMLNLKKFESLFGKQERTPFEEGIKKTVDWYKSLVNR
ncbi:MAG: NAD-dependent epimerase/dehydratase family protein [Candidatus Moranbacteria bacterium]|nr:NAD-dependent epimerase/dehydratase family protein [Candidatus Moranbacteria bacterium]